MIGHRLPVAALLLGMLWAATGTVTHYQAPASAAPVAVAPTAARGVHASLVRRARSARPLVLPIAGGLQVLWAGTSRCKVRARTPSGHWSTRATGTSPQLLSGLRSSSRFRVKLRCRRGGHWLAWGRPSKWVRPGKPAPPAANTSPGTTDQPGTSPGSGSAGSGAADPAVGDPSTPVAVVPPGSQPPAGARVIWVDPGNGSDAASGSRADPLRTVAQAWASIPASTSLVAPVWVQLLPGTFPDSTLPSYWEHRWGTQANPVVLNAAAGAHTVRFTAGVNLFDVTHLTFTGVDIVSAGDPFHCERCSDITVTAALLDGLGGPQEVVKANQSQNLAFVGNTMRGATQNVLDFVAVTHATISGNTISDAGDWCAYVKGGSSYIEVTRNEIFDCVTGGFTAGQGTGFEFMLAPWLRYEAYGVWVVDNLIHDTEGAGLGVNGGYNITLAHNTLYRVGSTSHAVEFVHGARGCDGDTSACQANHDAGGWGGSGLSGQWIPNRHVAFYNNVVYNPPGFASQWSHFAVAAPISPPYGSGVPDPARADDDLRIVNNVIWNGPADLDTGVPDPSGLRSANWVNTVVPELIDPAAGNYRLTPASPAAALQAAAVPGWNWDDSGVPAGATLGLPGGGALGVRT